MDTAREAGSPSEGFTGADTEAKAPGGARTAPSEEQVRDWLVSYVARLLDVDTAEIDPSTPLDRFGLDSAAAVALTADLSRWLDVELEANMTRGRPTIDAVARHVAQELGRPSPPAP